MRGALFGYGRRKRLRTTHLQIACGLCLIVALMTVINTPAAANAPGALTERKAIDLALSRPAYRELERGRASVAESGVTEAQLLPNPVLALERERVGAQSGRSTESSIRLSQTFDISGRRALRHDAAVNRLEAGRLEEQDRRQGVVTDVRRLFGEALYRQQHRVALLSWQKRIDSALEVVRKLVTAGETSGYDRRRLEREAQTVRARVASATADYSRAREVLRGLTGEPADRAAALDGMLMPDAPLSLETIFGNLRQRPDLASLNAQAAAFDHERSAAERGWMPDMTLGLGHKRIDEFNRDDSGVVLALSFAIPLFDRGQASEQRARAQANILRAEHALKFARSEAELTGMWQQTETLRTAASEFRRESLAASRELTRIAEAAYRAGEGGVLELLDAYRAELEAETTAIELELRARLARIELDALSGAHVHE